MVDAYGFKFGEYARTIQFHLLSMFLPGLATGHVLDRLASPAPVLLTGCGFVAGALRVGLVGQGLSNFNACLVLLGVGWNLLSIGSTRLLLASTRHSAEAPSAQAAYEFAAFVANGSAAFVAGYCGNEARSGWRSVLLTATPVVALAALASLSLLVCGSGSGSGSAPPSSSSSRGGGGEGGDPEAAGLAEPAEKRPPGAGATREVQAGLERREAASGKGYAALTGDEADAPPAGDKQQQQRNPLRHDTGGEFETF